jgi:hypothetical protein
MTVTITPLHDRINDIDIGKEFGVERLAPRGGRQLVDRRSFGGPGGIDEDVNRAEAVFDRLDHVRRRGGVDQIGGDAKRVSQLRAGALDVILRARADCDPGALGGEGARAGEADALRPAGDQNDLARKTKLHRRRLSRASNRWSSRAPRRARLCRR